jgi:hypothetical protein
MYIEQPTPEPGPILDPFTEAVRAHNVRTIDEEVTRDAEVPNLYDSGALNAELLSDVDMALHGIKAVLRKPDDKHTGPPFLRRYSHAHEQVAAPYLSGAARHIRRSGRAYLHQRAMSEGDDNRFHTRGHKLKFLPGSRFKHY